MTFENSCSINRLGADLKKKLGESCYAISITLYLPFLVASFLEFCQHVLECESFCYDIIQGIITAITFVYCLIKVYKFTDQPS